MRRLASRLQADVSFYDVDRTSTRLEEIQTIWKLITASHWDLIYQEGTGISGGINLIRAALTRKQAFVVSSGDPIGGYFHVTKGAAFGSLFGSYERLLYRTCNAFIGWTPYLTGAALKLGAKRAITIEGAVDLSIFQTQSSAQKQQIRQQYGIHPNHIVCGTVGSLQWTPRQHYCYGYELIETLKRVQRQDISIVIVGDGNGRSRLEAAVPEALKSRVIFTGRLPEAEVVNLMNAMDIGFVTQTLDELGNYRLTTKLPEYLACGLPVAMSPIPGFFDYAAQAGWALPAFHPAKPEFHQACARWLDQLTRQEIQQKATQASAIAKQYFDYELLSPRFCNFIHELLYDRPVERSALTTSTV
ncbi:glycosyltransferase [Cyanobacteria bacterium FACHB-63]|nr:glycosyltransferase [Cyanobacteria bacterium FACHB-63]